MVDMTQTITISINRYRELLQSEKKLDLLESYGVDNWCGFEEAMREFHEEEEVII